MIASGLFGTVNGSAIANAVTTGSFTIPLMIRAGYRPAFAAGVEATASMGGQLIPPVMGAAAFIMAETLGMPYSAIAMAATIPGVLYFVAVGVMVHFEAARQGLPILPRSALPRLGPTLKRDAHLLLGPLVLLYFLFEGRSPLFAGFWALVVAVITSQRRLETKIDVRGAFAILVDSAQNAMPVALACATVGIVVGVVSVSGLGLKLASGIVGVAGGHLFPTLVLTMIAALVLGTGLPTSATYIITSIMAAPALEQLDRRQRRHRHVGGLIRHGAALDDEVVALLAADHVEKTLRDRIGPLDLPCIDPDIVNSQRRAVGIDVRRGVAMAQFAARRDDLNSLLVFKCALLVMVRQTPAGLDAKKWSAVGPER